MHPLEDAKLIFLGSYCYGITLNCSLYATLQVAGMLIYYILTGGEHPYGASSFDIEVNIARGSPKLRRLTPETDDLMRSVLTTTPKSRPSVDELLRSQPVLHIAVVIPLRVFCKNVSIIVIAYNPTTY